MRSHRKKTFLPRPSRSARLQFRHARLRPPLRLLPELGHLASTARSQRHLAAARSVARNAGSRRPQPRRKSSSQHLQRAANHQRMGRSSFQSKRNPPACSPDSFPTATPRHKSSNTFVLISISTKSISKVSTIATTTNSADASLPSSTASAAFTPWDYG